MGETLKNSGESGPSAQGPDWEELKKVPFAGFGSRERQKLAEEGRIKETGAYVLGEQGEVVGVAPSLPEKYEKTNMKYERTIGGELEFLQHYLDNKRAFLEAEGKKEVQGDVLEAFERRREQGARLGLETQYVADLTRYFRTADEATLADLAKGDVVFEKIKSDIARTGKEASPDETAVRRKAQQRIFGVLRAKFEHGARFEGSDEGFVPVYDEDDVDVSDEAMEDEKVPFGASSEASRTSGMERERSREDEAFWRRMREHNEMRERERTQSRRYEEDKKRGESRDLWGSQDSQEELEEEMGM